jgi:hypothetical protein
MHYLKKLCLTLITIIFLLGWVAPVNAVPIVDQAYTAGIKAMQAQVAADPTTPTNKAFGDVLKQLFTSPAIQVPFRFVTNENGKTNTNYAGNVYFSQGDIFINYNESDNDEWFATVNNQLYTWNPKTKEGSILTRFPGDTLAFVMYMIDPSAIMRSIYTQYLDKPQTFTVKPSTDNTKTILFKKVENGFKGIRIQTQPFWLNAFLLESPKDKGGSIGSLEVDAPIALEAIPTELLTLPKGIKFKRSTETLKNRMTYL